jgi:hypothetical protein
MSRRLNNLLASMLAAGIGSVGVHLYVSRMEPQAGPHGQDAESPPSLQVKYEGIAPRRVLQLTAQRGYEETVRFVLWRKSTTRTGSGAGEVSAGLAAAEHGGMDMKQVGQALGAEDSEREGMFTLELEVDEADADTLTVEWDVTAAEVIGEADAAWTRAVAKSRSLEGTTVLARSGQPIRASIEGVASEPMAREIATLIRRWMAEPAPVLTDNGVSTRQVARVELDVLRRDGLTLTERHSAELTGSDLKLGDHLAMLEPSARKVQVAGDARWMFQLGELVATGDAGATAQAQLGFALGLAEVLLDTETRMELVVDRP